MTKTIEFLIEKHKGERTFFDGELLGVFFTINNLENLLEDYLLLEQLPIKSVSPTNEPSKTN
jgi:hypothetical protein